MAKEGGGQSQTQNTAPWKGQQPYLTQGFQRAESDVLNRPLEYFPGATYVPFSPETELALGATTNRSLLGNPLNTAAQGQAMSTLQGDYLAQGPSWDAMMDSVISGVKPYTDATFMGSGRHLNSEGYAEALGRGVGRGAAPLLDAERGRMMQATSLAPTLANQDYYDIAQLGGVGQQREAQAGEELQDSINRYNFAQGEPTERLAQYMNLIGGNYGSTGTSTTRADINPFMTALGAGLSFLPYALI